MTSSVLTPASVPPAVVPACSACDGRMTLVRERDRMKVGSRSATIEVDRYRCDSCGELLLTPEQMSAAQRTFAATIRQQEGLLSPSEIRGIRLKYNLTQAQFERLLGGAKNCGSVGARHRIPKSFDR